MCKQGEMLSHCLFTALPESLAWSFCCKQLPVCLRYLSSISVYKWRALVNCRSFLSLQHLGQGKLERNKAQAQHLEFIGNQTQPVAVKGLLTCTENTQQTVLGSSRPSQTLIQPSPFHFPSERSGCLLQTGLTAVLFQYCILPCCCHSTAHFISLSQSSSPLLNKHWADY